METIERLREQANYRMFLRSRSALYRGIHLMLVMLAVFVAAGVGMVRSQELLTVGVCSCIMVISWLLIMILLSTLLRLRRDVQELRGKAAP